MGVEIICAYLGVNINMIYVENNVIFEQVNDASLHCLQATLFSTPN